MEHKAVRVAAGFGIVAVSLAIAFFIVLMALQMFAATVPYEVCWDDKDMNSQARIIIDGQLIPPQNYCQTHFKLW